MLARTLTLCLSFVLLLAGITVGQSVDSLSRHTLAPGEQNPIIVRGKGLSDSMRAQLSCANAEVKVTDIQPEQVTLDIHLPEDFQLGPLGLYCLAGSGPATPFLLLVDDLAAVEDNGANHTLESAQTISCFQSVDGISDGPQSDFYHLHIDNPGQQISVEIITQQIESPMDPRIELLDASGNPLIAVDDDPAGPECRFAYEFERAGEYYLKITDSRFAAGGRYHLRVGDFPTLPHAYPLAASESIDLASFEMPQSQTSSDQLKPDQIWLDQSTSSGTISYRQREGQSAAWRNIIVTDRPQHIEPQRSQAPEPVKLELPLSISGILNEAREQDSYRIQGIAESTFRFRSKTRSLGCSTLLDMELRDASGKRVAGTTVSESDEWSFDFKFPDNEEYTLVVQDLMQRGGLGFGYYIETIPSGTFSVSVKADAATALEKVMEVGQGAFAVDLLVDRFGYDGELEIKLASELDGLRIVNPTIAAGAKEARIILAAGPAWQANQLLFTRLRAEAQPDPTNYCMVDSSALHRAKRTFIPFPHPWNSGLFLASSLPESDPYFSWDVSQPTRFATPVNSHHAKLNLTRLNAEFKASVALYPSALPADWSMSTKVEADNYTIDLQRNSEHATTPESIELVTFSEHAGRGRLTPVTIPIQWIEPLTIRAQPVGEVIAGQSAELALRVERNDLSPQAVSIQPIVYPPGFSGPESLQVAADQSEMRFRIQVPADITNLAQDESQVIRFEAKSIYEGHEFTVAAASTPLIIVPGPTQIAVFPNSISFSDARQQQQLVITGLDSEDATSDWTRRAEISVSDPNILQIAEGVITPKADGHAEVLIQSGTQTLKIPVTVTGQQNSRPIGFESEVLVALSKQGCNSGACHGSPSGKGMFRLSLRAFDRELDELTLIHEDFGRRLNFLEPEQSLLLLKPLMNVAHGGGKQIHKNDVAYSILRDWIEQGANPDPPETPRCVRLEVFPNAKRVLNLNQPHQQLAAIAHFSDGSMRDVTHMVAYESSNTSVAVVDVRGYVSAKAQGETVILVRYLEHIESVPLMFIDNSPDFQWPTPPVNNYVDELVHSKLRQLQYIPSDICTDDEFIRRLYLDVIGILPSVAETQAFLADETPTKRSQLIDAVLERREYAQFWALKWGDYLKLTKKLVGDDGVYKYHRWIESAFQSNMPYDEFARNLLTTGGSTLANPPANFYRTAADMNECVETISQVFLGARLQCAKCHNHPFERWTQDNYYGLGAFFNRVQRKNTARPGEMFIYSATAGEVTQPRTGRQMLPWLPQAGEQQIEGSQDRRLIFANWLLAEDNPYFARIEANRIWSQLFARGIVDPIDDFRDSNPPTNTPLLDALTQDFVDSGFDRKHLLRTILNSRTYQASYQTNETNRNDNLYFSHQEPRLLGAEQLLDAVNHVVGLTQDFNGLPVGTKATQLPAPDLVKVDFLKIFGQPERSTVCACERTDDSNLGMAIELFNGTTIHEKLRDSKNRFRTSLANGATTHDVIIELYLAAMCRNPTADELTAAMEHCQQREDPAAGVEDVCWALLNTDEFLFQH